MRKFGRFVIKFAVGAGASVLVMAGACIPDLPQDTSSSTEPSRCGDGYIDLVAGEECDPPGVTDAEPAAQACSPRCKVVCSGLKWSLNDHCYELLPTAAASLQGEASSRCASFRGSRHVVTFASEREFAAVARYVSDADAGSFWVGLWQAPDRFNSVNDYEPGWSPTCPGCFAHTGDSKAPLPRSSSVSATAVAGCVEGSPDLTRGAWEQYPCTGAPPLRVVCEEEPLGVHSRPCDAGICMALVVTRATKRYVYQSLPQQPAEAEARCHALGGSLVVLESRDEREQLWLELSRLPLPPSRVWIGLSFVAGSPEPDAGAWIWSDGTTAEGPGAHPAQWAIAQPSRSPHAYLSHATTQPPADDTLARTDPTVRALPYVCQVAVGSMR